MFTNKFSQEESPPKEDNEEEEISSLLEILELRSPIKVPCRNPSESLSRRPFSHPP
jgi:hypothetical protein